MRKTYVTTRDIIIPAGTELQPPPVASTRWAKDYEAAVGITRDHTAYFAMDIAEAIDAGFVRET